MQTSVKQMLMGQAFGARGCSSCSCDPCDCNPCNCGSSLAPSYPEWRVSGYYVDQGDVDGITISNQLILSLAQPMVSGSYDAWQEVILVPDTASPEQATALITAFEGRLSSVPAEVDQQQVQRPPVYHVHMKYLALGDEIRLSVSLVPDSQYLLRPGEDGVEVRSWAYEGPMASRGKFNTQK